MKILLLSFYYPPDLCPGSFRAHSLVQALLEHHPQADIEVVTTMPNRYSKFEVDPPPQLEQHGRLIVRRIPLPGHQSGMLDQSRAFLSFARGALVHANSGQFNVVCATSSRLMTAVLGAAVAWRLNLPLYLDIRDIFVDTIKDVLPRRTAILMKPLFALVERWAITQADTVNLVSRGFQSYFEPRYPTLRYTYFTNGIDDEFLPAVDQPAETTPAASPMTVLYAGNIGEGQGLHSVLPELARRLDGRVQFRVIGDGGRRRALEQAVEGLTNVRLEPPMKRKELLAAYRQADILFVHLNDYAAFRRVLPSKLFEYAATGKPVWAGVDGYAASFVRSEIANAAVFYPCDVAAAVASLEQLQPGPTDRANFIAKYGRSAIARQMASDIVALGQPATVSQGTLA